MAIEKRRIPKKDKAKRSLYMSAQTIKNLPKKKRIDFEGDKTPSGSGEDYTYMQGGSAVGGTKRKAIRTKYGDDIDVDLEKHVSFPDKKGGSETYRRKVKGKHRSLKGGGYDSSDTRSTVDSSYTKQTRGGKVLKKEQVRETEDSMKDIMKNVSDEVKEAKRKPKKKKKKEGWRLPTDKEKKEYKDSIPKYKKMYGGWLEGEEEKYDKKKKK
tara:strand:+ start:258 stop:893 length:636 start_codon:yes stop_codon:yes gene_type:complete